MTTSVGFTAPASCAAIRAGINGFSETEFTALGGEPIVGAQVPLAKNIRGLPRLAKIIAGPICECFDVDSSLMPEDVPLLLGVAEKTRLGRFADLDTALIPLVEQILKVNFHPLSHVVTTGRTSGAIAVHEATKLVNESGFRRVIVAGVDSFLVSETLDYFEDNDRLLTEYNSNGFIPGEAGAAILVGPDDGAYGVRIRSLGFANEVATIESDLPLRADGLATAYRQALTAAGIGLHDIDYRIADLSGEQYWFKEAALALARVIRVRKEFQEIWHPADCLGETGAAAAPCMMCIAWWAARKAYAPGPLVLAQSCGDDGTRIAIVLDGSNGWAYDHNLSTSRSN
jgi:3-oxoacyl-[acyl-carrier-protein] synthase-1